MAEGEGGVTIPQPLEIKTGEAPVGVSLYANKESAVVQIAIRMISFQDMERSNNVDELIKRMIRNARTFWNNLPYSYREKLLPEGADTGDV